MVSYSINRFHPRETWQIDRIDRIETFYEPTNGLLTVDLRAGIAQIALSTQTFNLRPHASPHLAFFNVEPRQISHGALRSRTRLKMWTSPVGAISGILMAVSV